MDPASLLAPLAAAPERTAIILDVDGTLAPIAPRPELAAVPAETKAELARITGSYLLVACLSGRPGEEVARLVGIEGIRYVGNHGLELDGLAEESIAALARFRDLARAVWPIEDKGLSLAFHYREADDPRAARRALERLADLARSEGLDARWGRKVLEIRPPIAADKGTALRRLITEAGADQALYAGDDTTDVDAFRGLGELHLRHAVRIAVSSLEAPPALIAAADLVAGGPGGLLSLLRLL